MANVSILPTRQVRLRFQFIERNTTYLDEQGRPKVYPVILLVRKSDGAPVAYCGLERYIMAFVESESKKPAYLKKIGINICSFLNYVLWETEINKINECSLDTIRGFFKVMVERVVRGNLKKETYNKCKIDVLRFLENYYLYNKDIVDFNYDGSHLMTTIAISGKSGGWRYIAIPEKTINVKIPGNRSNVRKKNRALMMDYVRIIITCAQLYDRELALAIALQAYAGLREGEVVNLSFGKYHELQKGFRAQTKITLDLLSPGPFWNDNSPVHGEIKVPRPQEVYQDFTDIVSDMFAEHRTFMQKKGYSMGPDDPLFRNKQGRPLTVSSYQKRVRDLFYDRFLPVLSRLAQKQGNYGIHAAYIDAYNKEYPGAHMFRHWFTMYLLKVANLGETEIQNIRGDSSPFSQKAYIRLFENDDYELYENIAYKFQQDLINAMEK